MNLSDAIRLYLSDRKSRGIKPNTLRNEKRVLELLLADIGNVQVNRIRPQHLDVFWSRRLTWGPGTANVALSSLSLFFKWCQQRGYMKRGETPVDGSRKLTVAPRKRIIIPQQKFETFLDGIGDARTRAMCAIGLYLFTRVSETALLRWQDVDMDNGIVAVFREKTSTLDDLPLCDELLHELRRWQLAYAAKIGRPILPADYVIPAYRRAQVVGVSGQKGVFVPAGQDAYMPRERPNLTYSIRRALRDAGYYQKYEGGHTLRRSGATALYNELTYQGHDRAIRVCQAMLGHSNIRTTEVYLRLDLDRKVRNDLLSNQRMFPERHDAPIVTLGQERA